MKLTKKQIAEGQQLAREFPLILHRLQCAGLYETAAAFKTGAMQKIGWELAERLTVKVIGSS